MVQSICPTLYKWEQVSDSYRFRDKKSGDIFGSVSADRLNEIRSKMTLLALAQAPVGLFIRIPYRILALLSGDFVREGYDKAEKEWKLERQVAYLDNKPVPSGNFTFGLKVSKKILWQLAKNVVKITTYPLALIAMEFAALYGIFQPLTGRAIYASIEHAWSRDWVAISSRSEDKNSPLKIKFGDYFAPCLQPKRVVDEVNLYRMCNEYNSQSLNRQLHELRNFFAENREFFSNEGLAHVGEKVEGYLLNKRCFNHYNSDTLSKEEKQAKVMKALLKLTEVLKRIEELRELSIQGRCTDYHSNQKKTIDIIDQLEILDDLFTPYHLQD